MTECLKCNAKIPTWVEIDGKRRNLNSRKYCLTCSPFGEHNTKKLNEFEGDLNQIHKSKPMRQCRVCRKTYEGGHHKHKDLCDTCKSYLQRKNSKEKAVELKGGKCQFCGYNKCVQALDFHHLDMSQKSAGVSSIFHMSWDKIEAEIDKCVLVCANCHGEIHDGLICCEVTNASM